METKEELFGETKHNTRIESDLHMKTQGEKTQNRRAEKSQVTSDFR